MADCTTVVYLVGKVGHGSIPSWLVPGTRDFDRYVKRVGLPNVLAARQVHLQGFEDVRGNHWCGLCWYHAGLIDLGEELDYPSISLVGLNAGYGAWLAYAQHAGGVAVESAVRGALKRLGRGEWDR